MAGEASFRRGEGYVPAVEGVEDLPGGVVATVHGTEPYTVRLGRSRGALTGQCSCPYGVDGTFCKHCVAVGLVLLERGDEPGEAVPDLRGYLRSLDVDTLAELLYRHAERDPMLYRELVLRCAREGAEMPDVARIRRQLDTSLRTGDFVGYHGSFDYAHKADSVLDTLSELVTTGHAREAGPLARRAVERITSALEHMDDSSGVVGDACHHAMDVYAQACTQAPPDPEELAGWLLDLDLNGPGWPEVDLRCFADALGATGVKAVRAQVERLWARVPQRAGPTELPTGQWMRQIGLRRLREQLAEIDGDVDARVAILAEELPRGDVSHRIATVLWEADRPEDAIARAREGLETDGLAWRSAPLADFLAEAYLDLGRDAEALSLRRTRFEAAPTRDSYGKLRDVTTRMGHWADLHAGALQTFREAAAATPGVADQLVHALLDEDDVDAAWQALHDHDCASSTWLAAAPRRAATNPGDTIPVYRRAVEEQIGHKKANSYRAAADTIRVLRDLHARCGTPQEFRGYLDQLRERHRRKTRLLAELDNAGLR